MQLELIKKQYRPNLKLKLKLKQHKEIMTEICIKRCSYSFFTAILFYNPSMTHRNKTIHKYKKKTRTHRPLSLKKGITTIKLKTKKTNDFNLSRKMENGKF